MTDRMPAEVFPPGEFLRDELEVRGWTQTEFAEIIKRPTRVVNEIIAAKRSVTPETARALSAALGTSAQLWMNLETSYQLWLLSKNSPPDETITQNAKLRERFPVREMIKRGWIEDSPNFDVVQSQVLAFYNIRSVDDRLEFAHAAKRRSGEELSPLQLAWILRVKQLAEAHRINTKYTKEGLTNVLNELSNLMVDPEEIRQVPRILAECGVRFVIVEPMSGSKIDGVCFWINDGKSPVLGMTLLHDRIDNFWFVLRHEIEHILCEHGKQGIIIDEFDLMDDDDLPDDEQIANAAAEDFCVPKAEMDDFIARVNPFYSDKRLRGFAKLMQRHPGIVAGQLRNRTKRFNLFSKYLVKVRKMIVPYALTDGYEQVIPLTI